MTARWTRIAKALAWTYTAALVVVLALFAFVGERWWPVAVLLYVPRLAFALPLVVTVPMLWRMRRLLWTQGLCAALVLGPLMGLHVSFSHRSANPGFRLLTYNVWYGNRGNDAIFSAMEAAQADVIVVQATSSRTGEAMAHHFAGLHVQAQSDFAVATRYRIVNVYTPPMIGEVSAAFVRYTIETPLGEVDLFNVHPYSPREGFSRIRGGWVHTARKHGSLEEAIARDTSARDLQLQALVDEVGRSQRPVIIAGDTNLPERSLLLREYLDSYRDAFVEAGNGYGYTFPCNRFWPWMRIDRVLLDHHLRAVSAHVGGRGGSDHCPLVVDLERR
jgi:endonuclease/exonuclease/phosphatase (EEP) superfamily protein YafD